MSDPINPAHYNGTACAEIGERLTANSYQVLKYNWRLGLKDDPVIEIGKSLWYLDREIKLGYVPNTLVMDDADRQFFQSRMPFYDANPYLFVVCTGLLAWNTSSDVEVLVRLRQDIVAELARIETARTGQSTMEV